MLFLGQIILEVLIKYKMISNKGQSIGTGITWVLASLIIFFILVFFVIFAGILAYNSSGDKGSRGLELKESEMFLGKTQEDIDRIKLIDKFLIKNKVLIFDWADDSFIYDRGLDETEMPKDSLDLYDKINNSFGEFALGNGIENGDICLIVRDHTENKDKIIGSKESSFGFDRYISSDCNTGTTNKLQIVSDNGKLIEVYYKDETSKF